MTQITLLPPQLRGNTVEISWRVEPATPLYLRQRVSLTFPDSLDLAGVPEGAWWYVALLCLHSHWALLRPCRVVVPVALPEEVVAWLPRLVDTYSSTLNAYKSGPPLSGPVLLQSSGRPIALESRIPEKGRCATAFSSGKDSLLQAGLLRELSSAPILVTTTSPMPGLFEHQTRRRREVLQRVAARTDWTHVEVQSDYRSCWDNQFARSLGYNLSVNEICDTFLYSASLLIAGLALGANHLFLASETEVSETVERDGRVLQHPHFMYSVPTLRVWDAMLLPLGVRYGSLTSALHSFQVQELLCRRYPDLQELQYSCWRVQPDEATCSRCPQCLRIAYGILNLGGRPSRIGIDLTRLLIALKDFTPIRTQDRPNALPDDLVRVSLHAQLIRTIQATPPWRVLLAIAREQPRQLFQQSCWDAVRAHRELRRRLATHVPGPRPGFRTGFLAHLDPLLRDRVSAIFAKYFPAAEQVSYADTLARVERLTQSVLTSVGQVA